MEQVTPASTQDDWNRAWPAPLRYTSCRLPPYRFVPGRHPHPTSDPRGHSYVAPGASHPEAAWVVPEAWAESEDYLYACDLYNLGYWWEAHEAWEGIWQLTDKRGPQGRFLQGMIQVAACHLKRLLGHRRGVERLRGTSRAHLSFVLSQCRAATYMGLPLAAFMASVDAYYVSLVPGGEDLPPHDPSTFPFIRLVD